VDMVVKVTAKMELKQVKKYNFSGLILI